MSLRALVIDDEPLARQSVRRFLKAHPDIEVIGECGDGQSAIAAILAQRPDLVFLDIQMPEMDGFQVLARIGVEEMPATIFVTAYDQYALQAFDANAIDYLLKPFGRPRFDRAVARMRERVAGRLNHEAAQQILRAIESASRRPPYADRFPVPENGRIVFVESSDIRWVEANGNCARLHTAKQRHDIRKTLTDLEGKLDPARFVRIHRSAIVNIQFVKEVQPWFHGYHLLVMDNGQKLRMSRYQTEAAERLGASKQVQRERPRNSLGS